MYELCWDQVDFSKESYSHDNYELSNEYESTIKNALLGIGWALLILGGMIVVAVASVTLYKTYTQDKQIEAALQMAREDNRQIGISTDNRFKMTLNVNNKSSLSLAGESANITTITVYPKGYLTERVITPNGNIITPYSLVTEY
ncbi:hypothetical protein [Amedibacillus sp. YH-ame10]